MRRRLHVRDPAEAMRLRSEYLRAQMRSLVEQANEMGQIINRGAMGCRQA
jgi:hypothetical protein